MEKTQQIVKKKHMEKAKIKQKNITTKEQKLSKFLLEIKF
jgi:hypothetical protein